MSKKGDEVHDFNYADYDFDDDYEQDMVRPPDKSKKMVLIDDNVNDANLSFENDDDFLRYKFLIMHNKQIPNEIKTAMIQSKRDEMVRMRNAGHIFRQGTFNPFIPKVINSLDEFHQFTGREQQYTNSLNDFEKIDDDIDDITFKPPISSKPVIKTNTLSRHTLYKIMIELIFTHENQFNDYCDTQILIQSLDQYSENILDEIILQSDVCWGIRNCIETLCDEDKTTKNQLLKIFIPDSQEDYDNFVQIVEMQKQTRELQDIEEINRQILLQQELEKQEILKREIEENNLKQKNEEISRRKNLIDQLLAQLTRLGGYDKNVAELKSQVLHPLNNFCDLTTEKIILNNVLYGTLVSFINGVRLNSGIKEELISYIECCN